MNEYLPMLKKNHEEVKGILKQLKEAKEKDSSKQEDFFQKIREEMLPQVKADATAVYPPLMKEKETCEGKEGTEEHHVKKEESKGVQSVGKALKEDEIKKIMKQFDPPCQGRCRLSVRAFEYPRGAENESVMTHYPEEFKATIIARMFSQEHISVPALSADTGIPKDVLYGWRIRALRRTGAPSDHVSPGGGAHSREEKFSSVLETAGLNELELDEYCRRKGLFPEQVAHLKEAFNQGASSEASRTEREQMQQQARTIKQLQSELHRKDRALAEAAALLVLEKKVQALCTEPEDENNRRSAGYQVDSEGREQRGREKNI